MADRISDGACAFGLRVDSVSAAQVAIKWSLQRGVAVVVGTDNPAHMRSDLDVWDFTLSAAEVEKINAIQHEQ